MLMTDFFLTKRSKSGERLLLLYYNVQLIPSPESPDDFATDVLLIIDWSMDIYSHV